MPPGGLLVHGKPVSTYFGMSTRLNANRGSCLLVLTLVRWLNPKKAYSGHEPHVVRGFVFSFKLTLKPTGALTTTILLQGLFVPPASSSEHLFTHPLTYSLKIAAYPTARLLLVQRNWTGLRNLALLRLALLELCPPNGRPVWMPTCLPSLRFEPVCLNVSCPFL